MNKEQEQKLREEYRDYTIEEARNAVADATKIDVTNSELAAILLQLRVPKYNEWKKEKEVEHK